MKILPEAEMAITLLNKKGFEAYVVGGCVRDSLLGRAVQDWDIATNATPPEIQACFENYSVIETGLKHGTLTVLIGRVPLEITTYRIDGDYSDCRRPDDVMFTSELHDDLRRRDFTVNAMAYHPRHGIVDDFEGREDLARRRIICVGDPETRFNEDALRILRAVRFSSALGFEIAADTHAAMIKLRKSLACVSPERIAAELNKLLTGEFCERALLENAAVIMQIIPELDACVDFLQHTPYHSLDVWRHTVKSVAFIPQNLVLRLTMLFHDCGKPNTFTMREDGIGHFFGHAAVSAEIAGQVLTRLRYDNATRTRVVDLIFHHGDILKPEPRFLKRRLSRMGEEALLQMLAVKRADCLAKATEFCTGPLSLLDEIESVLREIIASEQCFRLKDLAINGNDLLGLGFLPDKRLGMALNTLLELVIDEQLSNDRQALLNAAKRILDERKTETDYC